VNFGSDKICGIGQALISTSDPAWRIQTNRKRRRCASPFRRSQARRRPHWPNQGHRANSFAYPAADQPSPRACGFAFAGTRSCCCHARTEDNTRSKKRDGADLGSARPASEASCADEKDTAIDRLADDRDAFDHSHPDTEAAIGNRAIPMPLCWALLAVSTAILILQIWNYLF
jgi:hypothetical protein